MSLINLARETAEKKVADEAEQKQLEALYEAHLQDRLEKLRQLVLAEVREMDLEQCKYGRLIVTIEDGEVRFNGYPDNIGRSFARVSIPESDANLRVLELCSKIDIGMAKYSDESEPQEYRDPTVYASGYLPSGHSQIISCTDREDSTTRFFDDLGKQLSVWF